MSISPTDLPYYQLRSLRKTDEEKTRDQQRINDLVRQDFMALRQRLLGEVLGPGEVRMWLGSTAPTGWAILDGSSLNRNVNPVLFAIIGYTYGGSSNTFFLPDLRSRVPVAAGQGAGLSSRPLGSTGGEETHTTTVNEMPSHTHTEGNTGVWDNVTNQISKGGGSSGEVQTVLTTGSTGGGVAHNNMQPYLAVNFIVRLG